MKKPRMVTVRIHEGDQLEPLWDRLRPQDREWDQSVIHVPQEIWAAYEQANSVVWQIEAFMATLPAETLPGKEVGNG